jgi:hypothetical protein
MLGGSEQSGSFGAGGVVALADHCSGQMVKSEVNSNRLVSGKGISIPAAASLEFLVAVTETILARGDRRREVCATRVVTLMRKGALRESAPIGPEAETRASARGSRVARSS